MNYAKIIKGISQEIAVELNNLRGEWEAPVKSCDESEQYMKSAKDRITRLRQIRIELEHLESRYTGQV